MAGEEPFPVAAASEGASIYGDNLEAMEQLVSEVTESLESLRRDIIAKTEFDPIEHCLSRIKSEESMRDKCRRRGLPETTRSALVDIHDAIGFRVVCAFLSDVYLVRDHLEHMPGFEVAAVKDFIRDAKENGYRSYHMIMRTTDGRAPSGCGPAGGAGAEERATTDGAGAAGGAAVPPDDGPSGGFFIEIQLRTISMDTWATLEHHLKYKKEAPANERLIVAELKRCADELASTDISMQALRDLILGA